MRRNRKVKILATLGPASSEEAMIEKLFLAGADLFRINMSHASHDVMRTLIARIRSVEKRMGRPIGILADIQGPKLRVGKFANTKVTLTPGQTFTLDNNEAPGDETRVFLPHPEILESVKVGDRLLIDDGKLHLQATKCDGKSIVTEVISGTSISDRKGVSLPDTLLAVGVLTEKDRPTSKRFWRRTMSTGWRSPSSSVRKILRKCASWRAAASGSCPRSRSRRLWNASRKSSSFPTR